MPIFKKTSAAKTAMILLLIGCSSTPKIGESSATSLFSNDSSTPGSSEVTSTLTSTPSSSNEVISSGTSNNDSSSTGEDIPIENAPFDVEFVDGGVAIKDYDLSVSELIIPDSIDNSPVVAITEGAFAGGGFESVTIPASITSIGAGAFQDCNNLTSMSLPFIGESRESNQFLGYIFGAEDYLSQKDYIPESLRSINFFEQENSESAKRMAPLPSVSRVWNYAFYGCIHIEEVILPSSLLEIGDYAFYDTGVKTIDIPSSVTDIGNSAFADCSELFRINMLGTTPPTLGANAFDSIGENALIKVPVVAEANYKAAPVWSGYAAIIFSDNTLYFPYLVEFNTAGAKILSYEGSATNLIVPATFNSMNVVEIAAGAFYKKNLVSVSLPDSIEKIGKKAFANNQGLTTINLPLNLLILEEETFSECVSLTTLTLPNGLQEIQRLSLWNTNIVSLNIPSSVLNIGNSLFGWSAAIIDIIVDPSNPNYSDISGVLYDKSGTDLLYFPVARTGTFTLATGTKIINRDAFIYTKLSHVIFNDEVEFVYDNAFFNCNLQSVTLSEQLNDVIENPFVHSYLLHDFIVPSTNLSFSVDADGVLYKMNEFALVAYPTSKFTAYYKMLPTTGIVSINAFVGARIQILETNDSLIYAGFALTNSQVQEVILTENVMSFYNSYGNNIERITVDPANLWLADVNGVLFNKDLTELIAYPTRHSVSSYAIPNGTIIIKNNAFMNVQLGSVIIPASVLNIEHAAFEDCNIGAVRLLGSIPPALASAWAFRIGLGVIEVPVASLSLYQTAPTWDLIADRLVGY